MTDWPANFELPNTQKMSYKNRPPRRMSPVWNESSKINERPCIAKHTAIMLASTQCLVYM